MSTRKQRERRRLEKIRYMEELHAARVAEEKAKKKPAPKKKPGRKKKEESET